MPTTHPVIFALGLVTAMMSLLAGWRFAGVLRRVSWLRRPPHPEIHREKISVIIPARNEAAALEPALRSVLAQIGVDLEVIVVNDHSTDATGPLADAVAARDPRLRVVHDPELRSGWLGKQNAMQWAAQEARGEYLIFTDADILHSPDCFAAALSEMKHSRLDFLSLLPRIRFVSVLENAHLPNVVGFFLFFMSAKHRQSENHVPVAAGAFMLLRRDLFFSWGGLEPIRSEILDDVALARWVKARGHAVDYHFAPDLLSVRMFQGNRQALWGATKNILSSTGGRPWLGLPLMFFPFFVYGMPWVCLGVGWVEQDFGLAGLGLATYVLQYLKLWPARKLMEFQALKLAFFPLVAVIDACCFLRALYYHYGHGAVLWRGRAIKVAATRSNRLHVS